jgi:hypothetical protein
MKMKPSKLFFFPSNREEMPCAFGFAAATTGGNS